MFIENTQTIQPLKDGLTLKSIHTIDDLERWALFQAQIHGEGVAEMSRALLLYHPATRPEHWLYIEEVATQRIVSALCLIPWRWRYDDVELRAGEVGIVGTLEEFRNRGLSRALTLHHQKLLHEGEYDLSPIQGIPYFYRQFGYEYTLPLEGGWHLELRDVREVAPGFTIRPATEADIPVLMPMYEDAARDLAVSACRGEDEWRFILTHSRDTELAADYYMLLDVAGQPAGYAGVQRFGFGEGLNVSEVSRLRSDEAIALLGFMKALASERDKPFIRLIPPEKTTLQKIATAWGAKDSGRYAWQINIPNAARLMRSIGSVLERRISNSPFAGLSDAVHINLYREGVVLHFEAGKLARVEAVPGSQWEPISLPPLLFAPLVLGWRSADQLSDIYPDVGIVAERKPLVDVLFPRMESWIYSQY
jgi:hypothetical protein